MTVPAPPVPLTVLGARVYAVARLLADCLCTMLAQQSVGGPVCRCQISPGALGIADTCEKTATGDGQAWVRPTRLYRTAAFPTPVAAPPTAALPAVTFEVGVLRCAATMGDDGSPPSVAALEADAAKVIDDAAVLSMIDCCVPYPLKSLVGPWTPSSGGGCTGGTVTLDVHLIPGAIQAVKLPRL